MNRVSRSVQSVKISGIRKFYDKVLKYPDAISLTLGQPDFNVPYKIKRTMIKAIEDNKTTYTPNAGIIELREEISKYLKNLQINYSRNEIYVTVGGSEALMDVFAALINPGDKVLIPDPAYPAYESCVKILGGNAVTYNLKDDFSIDFDYLKRTLENEKPKAMVLSYPSNPTGAVLSENDNKKLHNLIKENKLVVISDEIYASINFEGEHYSPAQYSDIKDQVILVSGFSKMFSMTGLRIGYVCAVKTFMDQIAKVHQYNVSCAPSVSQWGAYEGLKRCMEDVNYMRSRFKERRDYMYDKLQYLGFELNLPKGAFYVFPSIKNFNMESDEFCEKLLKEAKVAVVPGSAFGKKGEGHIRISYAYSMDKLKSSMGRMESWIINNF